VRIGILGGAFDPPHIGHLLLAERACEQARLSKVLFIPAARPPFKLASVVASAEHRLAMTRLAIASNPLFAADDRELRRPETSFTIDTVRELRAEYGKEAELCLLVGSDALAEFGAWKSAEEILRLASLLCAMRPGASLQPQAYPYATFEMPALAISSTELRATLARGGSIRYLVPEDVISYIGKHKLYEQ
jgi:nicotinate-nucleotide adenylyltransferase